MSLFIYFIIVTIFFLYRKFFYEKNLVIIYVTTVTLLIISSLIGMYSAPNIDKERYNLKNTISSIFDKDYPENSARINYWKTAIKIFEDEPITGIGTGSWFGIYPNYNGNIYNDENILKTSEINPHNDYLEVLSENGIFGFIFYTILLLTIGIKLLRETKEKILVLPILLSYFGFLVVSFISFPKDNVSLMILLVSIVIIAFNYIRYDSEITYLSAIKDKATGNYQSMLKKFENIERIFYPLDANRMPVEYYRGVGYFELKDYNDAMNSFNSALELAPYVPAIKSNIASSFYMLKDNENAIKLLMDMKMDFPFFVEPQINLLAIYANTGQDSLAQILLNEINKKSIEHEFIKNYFVLEKIKVYYNEKYSP
ncbi:MAG: O-antigen ligase family protein [Ignavibacteriae bacterium]|nr:O-antigen ligase family protein [Ignavibacteriota bacterium]